MSKALGRRDKFWPLLLLGIAIYLPFFVFSLMIAFYLAAILELGCFLFYCYGLYRWVYKKVDLKYPSVPPEGRVDVYYRFNIPRPIHEDVRRYPEFFGKKKKQKDKRMRRGEKKT